MHRSLANSYTKRAQFAAIILVASGGAVAFAWPGKPKPPEPPVIPEAKVVDKTEEKRFERDQIAQRAAQIGNKVDVVAAAVIVAPKPVAAAEMGPFKLPEPPPPAWRYLGAIFAPGFERAVISEGTTQKLLAVGQRVVGNELLEINQEFVRVRDDKGVEKRIDIAPKQKPQLRLVGGGGAAPAPVFNSPANAGVDPNGMNPEERAKAANMEAEGEMKMKLERLREKGGGKDGGRGGKDGGGKDGGGKDGGGGGKDGGGGKG